MAEPDSVIELSDSDRVARLQSMSDLAVAAALDQERTDVSARQGLEALYESHCESVFRYLRAILRDDDEALDLTAMTFERAFAELRKGP